MSVYIFEELCKKVNIYVLGTVEMKSSVETALLTPVGYTK